jgi:D-alanyl-D-alanine carboxypeptidase (penicillin-binding protein 5/6)
MFMLRFILTCVLALSFSVSANAFTPPETTAREAYIIDFNTGAVLFDKLGNEKMPTSSMSKVMTMIVVFDAIRSGKLSMEQELPVSEKAWAMQGSKMFVDITKPSKVSDLVRGVIVQSGNDACIVLAEAIAGSEENFAQLMNQKAKEIGMNNSNFMNSTGWPDDNHYSTPHDLALLANYLIKNYPEEYKIYSELEFTYNNIKQGNRNPLLYNFSGGDGVKTGHTEVAGYGLIGSAIRNDRRVIMVINGTADMQARADEARKLMDWAFVSFKNIDLAQKDKIYTNAPVLLSAEKTVGLTVANTVQMTVPTLAQSGMKISAKYSVPLVAPLKAGDKVGTLIVTIPNLPTQEIPLVVAVDVAEKNWFASAFEKLKLRIIGTPIFE